MDVQVASATAIDYSAVEIGGLCPHNDGGTFETTGGRRPALACTKNPTHRRRFTQSERGLGPFESATVLDPPVPPPAVAGEA